MSYVAIARKWRPTSFEDIAGQQHVTRTLQNAIRLGRIHHAFLFTGARGVGKTSAARVLARALNCVNGPTPEPCGECPSCLEIATGGSSDVIEIDGASNNSVEDIRELRESVRYLPQRGHSKVYIVDEVHMLSRGAFNALLKTLEEPPDHVVFIFATTEPQKIPDTILSRVQRFDFKRIPASTVVETLQKVCEGEGVSVPEGALRLIARAGEGSMRDSQSLLDRVISFSGGTITTEGVAEVLGLVDRELLFSMLSGMLRGEPDQCLEAIDKVHGFGYDLTEFTSEMLELLRNATLVGLSPTSRRYLDVPAEEQGRLAELANEVPTDVFVRSFQVMLEVHEQVARAARPRIVLEMAVARLVSIRPARPVDQIVQRLADLERRMRQGGVPSRPRSGGSAPSRSPARGGDDDDDPAPAPVAAPAPAPAAKRGAPPPAPAPAPTPSRAAATAPSAPERRPPPLVLAPAPAPVEEAEPLVEEEEAAASRGPELLSLFENGVDDPDTEEGEDEAVRVDAPPPLPAGATDLDRFLAFQTWIEQGGSRWSAIAMDVALDRCQPPTVYALTPHDLHQRNAQPLLEDPRVRAGITAVFPGCHRLEIGLRPPHSPAKTRREQVQMARAQLEARLREEVLADPRIQQIQGRLSAQLQRVAPPDEAPQAARKEKQR